MFFEAIWLVFLISFGLQLFYYLYFFRRLALFKVKRTVSQDQRSVSVVVCAHNEEQELPDLLAALCRQNVETFELVLVDDASTDGTAELMRAFQKIFINYRYCIVFCCSSLLSPNSNCIHNKIISINKSNNGRSIPHINLAITNKNNRLCLPSPKKLVSIN